MISFAELAVENDDMVLDLTVPDGASAAIVTAREIENEVIVRLLLGFHPPLSGRLTVNGIEPALLTDSELALYRRTLSVVYQDGGFISNLNILENITLVLAFDGVMTGNDLEETGRRALESVGYKGAATMAVSGLNLYQRRQIAFARMLISRPATVVYHATFDGLSRNEQKQLASLVCDYHLQGGRTSLFLTSNPDSLRGMDLDSVFYSGGANQL